MWHKCVTFFAGFAALMITKLRFIHPQFNVRQAEHISPLATLFQATYLNTGPMRRPLI